MQAVILFSHGSLLCGAGEQLEAHAARLRETAEYSRVEIGYLNYSSPSFAEAVQKCADAGATQVLIAPYFLIPGYFVQVGLPRVLAPEQARFPHIEFQIAPALGDHPLLTDALLNSARRATSSDNWRAILHSAPRYCERNPECPLFEKCRSENFEVRAVRTQSENSSFIIQNSFLLVMVHGSPKPESNADMFRVVERVKAKREYSDVRVGFMECNEPTIPDAIDELVNNGAKSIIAVPYFLHAGTHVADDLPSLLEAAQEKYSDVEFLLGDYLGREPLVTEVLRRRLQEIRG
jgi:sirohydrochlorin cobaltochelatase